MPRRPSKSQRQSSNAKHRSRAALLSLLVSFGSSFAQAVCRAMWDTLDAQFRMYMLYEPVVQAVLAQAGTIAKDCFAAGMREHAAAVLFSDLALAHAGAGRAYPAPGRPVLRSAYVPVSGRQAWEAAIDRCDGELCAAVASAVSLRLLPEFLHPAVLSYLALRWCDAASRSRRARNWEMMHFDPHPDPCFPRGGEWHRAARRRAARGRGPEVAQLRAARMATLAAKNHERALARARPAELRTCRVCGGCFASRSQLFRHLEASPACKD